MSIKATDKYQAILEASIELMKENGFGKTSVSEIVKRAGVAQGTFYLYFETKAAIVPAIAEKILKEQLELIKEADQQSETIFETLQNIVDITFEITKIHRDVIMFCYAGIAYYNSFRIWEEIYKPYYSWLAERFQLALQKEEIEYPGNLYNLAKMVIGLIENTAEVFYFSHMDNDDDINDDRERVLYLIKKALI